MVALRSEDHIPRLNHAEKSPKKVEIVLNPEDPRGSVPR